MENVLRTPCRVLFLGNRNAARSILAEAYLNWAGKNRFVAYSAGQNPAGSVDPLALEILEHYRIDARTARSKGWDEFFAHRFGKVDVVLSLHHLPIEELRDFWPGAVVADWRIADPTLAFCDGQAKRRAFVRTFAEVTAKVNALLDTLLDGSSRQELKTVLQRIGMTPHF